MIEISSMVFLAPALVARAGGEQAVREQWICRPKAYAPGEANEPIDPCTKNHRGWLGIPLAKGLEWAAGKFPRELTAADRTVSGKEIDVPHCPVARDAAQERFFREVRDSAVGNYTTVACAKTGSGKTVAACYVISQVRRTTLVIVPSKTLAGQWAEELKKHLGLHEAEIGIVQGGAFPAGKSVVIAVIHNLVMDYAMMPKGFAESFGLVIWDECVPAGTLVSGRRVETIQVGDYVESRNPAGKVEWKRVTRVWKRTLRNKLVEVKAGGKRLVCTQDHLVFTEGRGFVPAKDLHPSDACFIGEHDSKYEVKDSGRSGWGQSQLFEGASRRQEQDRFFSFKRVESVSFLEQSSNGGYPEDCPAAQVYDLEVEDNHNFFANDILVHNCHRVGAKIFSRSLSMFPAVARLALTATPSRKDGCWKLVEDSFGEHMIEAEGDNVKTVCYGVESPFILAGSIAKAPPAIQERYLTKHSGRNEVIVDLILDLYQRGRRFVVMSKSVSHLQTLQRMAAVRGMPQSVAGFYTGFLYSTIKKDSKGKPSKIVIAESERKALRESKTHEVLFGTYSQMKEGVDIPWLDAGIDALPLADGVQMIGRIRRRMKGKLVPCWFSIVDINIPRYFAFAKARLKGMADAGVTIEYDFPI